MTRLLEKLLPWLLIAAAVLCGWLGVKGIRDRQRFLPATALITEITHWYGTGEDDDTHVVTVRYTIGGTHYETDLQEYSASMREGKTINIRYDPENPANVVTASYTGVIVSFAMAVVALAAGGILLVKQTRGEA